MHQVGLCLPKIYPYGNLKPLTSALVINFADSCGDWPYGQAS